MHFETLFFTQNRYDIEMTDGVLRDNTTGQLINASQDPNTRERYIDCIPAICQYFPQHRIPLGLLVLLGKYKITIPVHQWGGLTAKPINGNIADVRISNLYFDFVNGPIQSEFHPGYYYVPEYKNIIVSSASDIISYATDKVVNKNSSLNFAGRYLEVSAVRADGSIKSCKVHLLTALAFCHRPGNPAGLTINHIDLDRTNNDSLNLEFIIARLNAVHFNLMSGNYGSVIKVIKNDAVVASFDTPYHVANYLNCHVTTVWLAIRHPDKDLIPGYKIAVNLNIDFTDLAALNAKTVDRLPNEKINCMDVTTGIVTSYNNPSQLCKAHGWQDTGVRVVLSRPRGTIYLGRYLLKYESSPWPTQEEIDANRARNAPKPVLVRDEITGELTRYPTAYQAISMTGDSKKVVTVSLSRGDRRLISGKRYAYEPTDNSAVKWHVFSED